MTATAAATEAVQLVGSPSQLPEPNDVRDTYPHGTEATPTEFVDLSMIRVALSNNHDDAATSVATALECVHVVCMTRERTVACVPCGHKCLCDECGKEDIVGSSCPLCRKPVAIFMRVFE